MNGFEFNEIVGELTDATLPIVTNLHDVFDIGGVRNADWLVLTEQEFSDIVAVLETAAIIEGRGSEVQVREAVRIAEANGTDNQLHENANNSFDELVDVTLAVIPGRNDENTYWLIEFHDDPDDWDN